MVFADLSDSNLYESLHPAFRRLFQFVKENDLSKFATQRIVLDGAELYINMSEPELKKAEDQKLEVHNDYIDVHFPLTGEEICGWTPLKDVKVESDEPFNEEGDFALYTEPAANYFKAKPGQFYIFWPGEAHAPIIGEGKIKKAVAKVLLNVAIPF